MKIKYILIALGFLITFNACEDEMNYDEFVSLDEEQVFSSFSRTMSFVSNIYNYLDYDFGDYGGAMLSSASDESDYVWTSSDIHDFYNGAWSASNAKSNTWNKSYEAIRAVNLYLDASEGQTFSDFKYNQDYNEQMERYERYQYEVRFLRAYFYFNLVRQYGDVPLVTKVLTEDEANSVFRTDKSEIFDFIVAECDSIVNNLPVTYEDLSYTETGRVSRASVLALKARTLLYQASSLFNTSNESSLWYKAALANKAVIDSCSQYGIVLGKYSDLWGTDNYKNSEMIFVRRVGSLNSLESYNFPIGVEGGNSGNCPTQTLVDAYEMKSTGLLWNEDGSGYNSNKPYEGRDPRFNMTVAKNGDTGWPTYNNSELQIFEGGANGSPISGASTTGYYLKKYVDASVDLRSSHVTDKRHSWITYRLGEFYLNYAEAVYHYLGSPDATSADFDISAVDAVNVIRHRSDVNMPSLSAGLTNVEFEAKYKNERMVELAFEGHRFWDVRRWKEGEVLKSVTCMKIEQKEDESFKYSRFEKERSWDNKMYFFPIPDSEIRKNPNLTQNTGW
ncbi:RagB/SusD family nutrient uptake outer membrane protein [Labilibaculum sp. K2S]|uniref:RagB/SusD family nutrient uptake outer membrane protein n=1 Tax=Labilibaculum sp. K2S TaxID=3056386 RepID=UPI0025A3946A|nr:RagB/SusD family nutrient uptake outer membrane protein [Labilibaculum sp. K2S]MDM8159870.1 RagB/SusD family nutrient uptake outer membrane protein [Labilibaculum sp. K2S]